MDNADHAELKRLTERIDLMDRRQSEMYHGMMGSIDAQGRRTPGALENQAALIVTVYGDTTRNAIGHDKRLEAIEARQDAFDRAWIKLVGITTGASAVVLFIWEFVKDHLPFGKK